MEFDYHEKFKGKLMTRWITPEELIAWYTQDKGPRFFHKHNRDVTDE